MSPGRLTTSGFTLLEIMLAAIILAMVVSMVTVSLSGSLRVVEETRDQGDIYYRARIVFERIGADLQSAVLMDSVEFTGGEDLGGEGSDVLLRFASMAHVEFGPDARQGGMAEIGYGLIPDPENEGQLILLRSDELVRPREEPWAQRTLEVGFLLSDRLRSVRLSYFDREGELMESWDTRVDPDADAAEKEKKRRLPTAVSCRLEYWLDVEEETSLVFQTMFQVPAGLIVPEPEK